MTNMPPVIQNGGKDDSRSRLPAVILGLDPIGAKIDRWRTGVCPLHVMARLVPRGFSHLEFSR